MLPIEPTPPTVANVPLLTVRVAAATGERAAAFRSCIPGIVEAVMVSDNEMKLKAKVNAPEGSVLSFQWQVSQDNGQNYSNIENATASEILVTLAESDMTNLWRVRVEAN